MLVTMKVKNIPVCYYMLLYKPKSIWTELRPYKQNLLKNVTPKNATEVNKCYHWQGVTTVYPNKSWVFCLQCANYIQYSIKSSCFRTHVSCLIILFQKHHILKLKIDNILTKVRTQIRGRGGVLGHFVWVRIRGGGGVKNGVCAAYVFYGRPHNKLLNYSSSLKGTFIRNYYSIK